MRNVIVFAATAAILAGAVIAQPAQAQCDQSGPVTVCRGAPRAGVVVLQQMTPTARTNGPGVLYELTSIPAER